MKQLRLLLAMAFVAALFVVSPATAQPPEAKGDLTLLVHTHSRPNPLDPTDAAIQPLYPPQEGHKFQFASARCDQEPPFNNRGWDANPNYPDVDDEQVNPRTSFREPALSDNFTAPVRWLVEGTFTKVTPNGKGQFEGTLTGTLCQEQTRGGPALTEEGELNQFVVAIKGHFEQTSEGEDELKIFSGTWKIISGTGTFQDLKGQGQIVSGPIVPAGFNCRPVLEGDKEVMKCTDFHATLTGKYSDTTLEPVDNNPTDPND